MEIMFNVQKEKRKELVSAVSEITGCASAYKGAPSFAFEVGSYTIDKNGTLIFDRQSVADDLRYLLMELAVRGFAFEGDINEIAPIHEQAEAVSDDLTIREVIPNAGDTEASDHESGGNEGEPSGSAEPCVVAGGSGKLSINFPLVGFTASIIDNLEKLIAAKAWILKKMAGTDSLPIKRDEKYLSFPWFKRDASAAEIDAYSRLVAGLCETAKTKQRVMATERQLEDGDNEKFKARCFLLSLGFIGKDYSQSRKILLAPMSGSGSFKNGNQKREQVPYVIETAVISAEPSIETIHSMEADSMQNTANAAISLKCGECEHHCYYTVGELRTSAGDIVDASSRTPDSYTHYCLKAPSGYRKLKHAVDWSGSETAPKWCPLYVNSDSCLGNAQMNGEEAV